VRMGELLPEFWAGAKEVNEEGCKAWCSRMVTEILQCFGTCEPSKPRGLHGNHCASQPGLCGVGVGLLQSGRQL
jgi:hypothetical protein